MSRPLHVLHIITSLDVGGAEAMLLKLLPALRQREIDGTVICLRPPGVLATDIHQLGFTLHSLRMARGLPGVTDFGRLRQWLRQARADVVQGWMYHGNLAATLGRLGQAHPPALAWNIRGTSYQLALERPATRWVIRAGGWLSRLPQAVIHNAHSSVEGHRQALGYHDQRAVVIGNGFDTISFRPDPALRASVRQELDVPAEARLFGHFARWHPMKHHAALVQALAALPAEMPLLCVLAGTGIDAGNAELRQLLQHHGVMQRVRLLGERRDMARLAAAIDVGILCSAWGEAFPNVVGELMSSGAPCIVTDVGDAAWLAGDSGWVVPAGDAGALAAAIRAAAVLPPERLAERGVLARERIRAGYEMSAIADQYAALYRRIGSRQHR